jgi:hypothetical protein
MQSSEQPPPHDANAELAVLSSIMLFQNEAIPICVEAGLRPEMLYVPAHQTILQDLFDVHDNSGKIELISFTNRLRSKGLLAAIGGDSALSDIQIFLDRLHNFAPTIADLPDRIELIRAAYVRRQIITGSAFDARRAFDPDPNADIDVLLDEIASRAMSLRSLGRNGANIEDAAVEIAKAIDTPPDVIDGVLHLGGKAAIGGASKARKTWMFIDMAVSVATGSVCLNNFTTTRGRVLYVNFELPRPFFWKRVQAICGERQLTLDAGVLEVHHLRGRLQDWLPIEPRIPPGKYSLIILEPSYKLLLLQSERLREENSSGVVATLLERFDRLAMRTGAAVAFGAHFSKGDQSKKESIDRISGSGVFARDPDTIIIFTELTTADCYAVEMTLRNHPPVEKFAMRWEYPLFVPDVSLDPTRLKQRKGAAEAIYQPEQLLEVLTCPMFAAQWESAARDKFEMSESTFKRLRYKLEAMGAISSNNRKWTRNKKWKPVSEE